MEDLWAIANFLSRLAKFYCAGAVSEPFREIDFGPFLSMGWGIITIGQKVNILMVAETGFGKQTWHGRMPCRSQKTMMARGVTVKNLV